jgi:hypothetical protein
MLEQTSGYYVSGARCRFLTWIPGFNCLGVGHFTPLPVGIRRAEHLTRQELLEKSPCYPNWAILLTFQDLRDLRNEGMKAMKVSTPCTLRC